MDKVEKTMKRCGLSREEAEDKVKILDARLHLRKNGLKRCSNCGGVKPLDQFRAIRHKDGRKSHWPVCLECKPVYQKFQDARYRNNRYFNYIYNIIRTRAKSKKIPFDLTPKFIEELYNQQSGLCGVTGLPMNFDRSNMKDGYRNPYMASLDRIVPALGYVQGNVRWVLFAINVAMGNWGEKFFSKLAEAYLVRRKLPNEERV